MNETYDRVTPVYPTKKSLQLQERLRQFERDFKRRIRWLWVAIGILAFAVLLLAVRVMH